MTKYEHSIELITQNNGVVDTHVEFWTKVLTKVNTIITESLGEDLVSFKIISSRSEYDLSWAVPTSERVGLLIGDIGKSGAGYHKGNKILIQPNRIKEYCNEFGIDYQKYEFNTMVCLLCHEIGHLFGIWPEVYWQDAEAPDGTYFESSDRGDCMELCDPEDPFLFYNHFHSELIRRNASLRNDSEYLINELNASDYPTTITASDAQTHRVVWTKTITHYYDHPKIVEVRKYGYSTSYTFVSTNDVIKTFITDTPSYEITLGINPKEEKNMDESLKNTITTQNATEGGLLWLAMALMGLATQQGIETPAGMICLAMATLLVIIREYKKLV